MSGVHAREDLRLSLVVIVPALGVACVVWLVVAFELAGWRL